MILRSATFGELDTHTLYALLRLRSEVFVVEQECAYLDPDGRDLEPGTLHVWLEDGGEPAAYLRVLADGDRARIGRVVVAKTARGGGHAATLMRRALELIGDRTSVLDAQSYLVDFYERFGYTPAGAEFVEDGIPHVPMIRSSSRKVT
jgi:ElaA protein